MQSIKVIFPAKQIPTGSDVTKRTGTKKYILKDEIRVFGDSKKTISSDDGVLFLVKNGDINVVRDDTELVWLTDTDTLYDLLEEINGY